MLGVTGLSLVMPVACAAQGADAAVAGVVRDASGTPQMGALVELLSSDASVVTSALTDTHGRYIMPAVLPGRYELRATAAFFVPTRRPDIRLHAGTQAVVNLAMNTLFEAENWLPAQRRRADEPADDWKWTLRSTANRPLLRLLDPQDGMEVSSSAERAPAASTQGQVALINGDGAFGDGGVHQVLVFNRTVDDGDGMVLRTDFGTPQAGLLAAPSAEVTAGYEKRSAMGGATRLVTSYQSHPELTNGFTPGFQVMQVASTEQLTMGNAVLIDVGTLLEAEQMQATRIASEPYLRVSVKPGSDVVVEYRMATGRELQSSSDLDRLKMQVMALSDANGKPLLNTGRHQEISVSRKLHKTVLTAAVFSDRFDQGALAGSGLLSRTQLSGASMIEDPTTGTFHLATTGYSGRGLSGTVMQPLTPSLSLWGEYDLGTALVVMNSDGTPTLAELQSDLQARTTQAASAAIRGKILRSGTAMKAEYRWQPARSLTQVNAYNTTAEEAYLSFYLRQRLHCGRLLPQGLDAVVEATNLLEQGYQPVLAPDGHTLFLAQIPRSVQGGLAFNF